MGGPTVVGGGLTGAVPVPVVGAGVVVGVGVVVGAAVVVGAGVARGGAGGVVRAGVVGALLVDDDPAPVGTATTPLPHGRLALPMEISVVAGIAAGSEARRPPLTNREA